MESKSSRLGRSHGANAGFAGRRLNAEFPLPWSWGLCQVLAMLIDEKGLNINIHDGINPTFNNGMVKICVVEGDRRNGMIQAECSATYPLWCWCSEYLKK
jgi:hypothetical protein